MFDPVVDHYDRARPSYPAEIYDALEADMGGLRGTLVLDVGAGTGIASRQLLERGAKVVAVDIGEQMLRRARSASPRPSCVVSDGNVLPFGSGVAQLVCFAQAWHWFDAPRAASEVARVLGTGGWWAAWWSHPRSDGEAWFDRYQDLMEATCPGYARGQRDTGNHAWPDEPIAATGLFAEGHRVVVPWVRDVSSRRWIVEERSKSYVDALAVETREQLLREVGGIIDANFPDGHMVIRYTTHMWIASVSAGEPRSG
jgi:SAM-dependent methyltransferase